MGYKKRETTPVMQCRHCGNKAPFEVTAESNDVRKQINNGNVKGFEEGPVWELLCCPSCREVSLHKFTYCELFDPFNLPAEEGIYHSTILYPTDDNVPDGLPENIEQSYREALEVRHKSPNSFGTMLGRVIEEICIDKGANAKKLSKKIENLAEMGEIPDKYVQIAHQIRELRNIGAHVNLGSLTKNEIPVLHALCDAILTYIYSTQKMIDDVEQRLVELHRANL